MGNRIARLFVGALITQLVACAAMLGIDDPTDKPGGDAGSTPAAMSAHLVKTADTVFDLKSKLTWQRNIPELSLTWEDAQAYCGTLALGNGGGWRLPTKGELLTIFDTEGAFAEAPKDWFWSASESTHEAGRAWAVGVGSYANVNDMLSPGRVLCVR
jgi:hypothetical protein